MSVPPHAQTITPEQSSQRFQELLEPLYVEWSSVLRENQLLKMQRDEYQRKFEAQMSEINALRQAVMELDKKHTELRKKFEDIPAHENIKGEGLPQFLMEAVSASGGKESLPRMSVQSTSGPMMPTPVSMSIDQQHPKVSAFAFPSGSVSSSMGMMIDRPAFVPPLAPAPRSDVHPAVLPMGEIGSDAQRHVVVPHSSGFYGPFSGIDKAKIGSTGMSSAFADVSSTPAILTDSRRGQDVSGDADWVLRHNPSVSAHTVPHVSLMHTFMHDAVVCCTTFSHDGQLFATGSNKMTRVFSIQTGESVAILKEETSSPEQDSYVRSVTFSPDGTTLATGGEDRIVKLWDIKNPKKPMKLLTGHDMDIYALRYTTDGRRLVSGSGDGRLKVWDTAASALLYTLGNRETGPSDGVTSVAISPDGRLVAAGSLDNVVRVWDLNTGKFLKAFEGHSDSVYAVAFTPDGRGLASGSLDRSIYLWDVTSGVCAGQIVGHKDYVLSLEFTPDGRWLLSGSKDRTVQFWDYRSSVPHAVLEGHSNSVISVSVNPATPVFATGSGDHRARVWKLEDAGRVA
eukprot:TRINITY_DN3697_c0_g1_i1.p1 TRINITY_DN3697_c0_g1~~TRINITY_DN3697_c0_g1_i1.p1  ORF type:complete len:569 (-),score=135.00 TRINITY_DN3697_c0_g1_i1:2046-3752(-)